METRLNGGRFVLRRETQAITIPQHIIRVYQKFNVSLQVQRFEAEVARQQTSRLSKQLSPASPLHISTCERG
jgi:hypothetical protein